MLLRWLELISASFTITNIYCAVLHNSPCVFPTCDLPPSNCGVIKDKLGCPTCSFVCRYGSFVCPQVVCINSCPDGYTMDNKGCQTCSCKRPRQKTPPPQPPLPFNGRCQTWTQCPHGLCPDNCNCQPNCGPSPPQRQPLELEEVNEG